MDFSPRQLIHPPHQLDKLAGVDVWVAAVLDVLEERARDPNRGGEGGVGGAVDGEERGVEGLEVVR